VLASLAAVPAIVFPGRGLCLGVSMHHATCDDASTMHFVHTSSAAVSALRAMGRRPAAAAVRREGIGASHPSSLTALHAFTFTEATRRG